MDVDLGRYESEARELLRQARAGSPDALSRFESHGPEAAGRTSSGQIDLNDALLVIARESSFTSWVALKDHVHFLAAVDALDSGDVKLLNDLLTRYPQLISYRCTKGEWYESGYFAGAMLLHHIAGNPIRCALPPNILEVIKSLLKCGADPNALCGDLRKSNTIGLVITSKQVSDAGVSLSIIDLLSQHGAMTDLLDDPDVLSLPLWNCGLGTARALAGRGARVDLRHAAGLGDVELVHRCLHEAPARELVERALTYAVVHNHYEIAVILLDAGASGGLLVTPCNWVSPRTALHEAANRGFRRLAELLLSRGASNQVIEPLWGGTPAGWARHGGHTDIAELLERQ